MGVSSKATSLCQLVQKAQQQMDGKGTKFGEASGGWRRGNTTGERIEAKIFVSRLITKTYA